MLKQSEEMVVASNDDASTITHTLHLIGNICEHMYLNKGPAETLDTFVQAITSNKQTDSRSRALPLTTLGRRA